MTGRGRPTRLPDESTASSARDRVNARVGWLLATQRMLGPHPEMAHRPRFVAALRDRGFHVDPSSVSRWETGVVTVSDEAVTLYEEVLGLRTDSLLAVVAGVRRSLGVEEPSLREGPVATTDESDVDLEPLCQRAVAGEATGAEWLSLTRHMKQFDLVQLRGREWAEMCARLVEELSGSVGIGHVRRYEAAVDLLGRTEAAGHLSEAVRAFVTDPDVQVASTAELLMESDEQQSGRLVTRLLGSDNPVVRMNAAWATAAKLARGHRSGLSIPRLESHVAHGLDYGDSLSDRLESTNLAVHLPQASWERVAANVDDVGELVVERARSTGQLMGREEVPAIVRDLADTAAAQTAAHTRVDRDPMLPLLLHEAVLHTDSSRRHQATLLLAASPYSPAIARQCRALAHAPYPVLAARMHEILIVVGGPEEDPEPVEEALGESREGIRARALMTIGHRAAELPERDAAAITEHTVAAPSPLDRASGLMALGMSGASSLRELADHAELGPAAQWWIDHGPAIRDPDGPHDVPDA